MQNIFAKNLIMINGTSPISVEKYSEIIRNIELLQKRAENEPNKGFSAILENLNKSLSQRDIKLLELYYEEEQKLAEMKIHKFRKYRNEY